VENSGILYFGLSNASRLTVSNVLDNQRFMDFRLEENSVLDISEWRNNGSNREFAYLGDVGVQDEENVVVGPAVIDNSQLIVRGNFTFHDFGWIRIDGGGSLEVNGYFPMGDSRAENEEPGNPASWPVERKIIVRNGTIATNAELILNAYSYIRIGDPEYDETNDPISPTLLSKGFFSGSYMEVNRWAQLWVDDWAQFLADQINVEGYDNGQRLYVFDTHYSDASVPTEDFPLAGPYDPWPFDFIVELLSGQCDDAWQGPPNSCTPDISLPVDLLSFTAESRDNTVLLYWKTASEENNDRFDVERSVDGINYNHIGTIAGHGTTSEVREYAFTDNTPPAGIVFYRLIQTDYDGTSAVYGPVSVQVDIAGQLLLYPNPVQSGACTVRVSGLKRNVEATITINDLTGKTVFAEEVATGAGGQAVRQINTGALGRGAYILHIADGDRIFKAKLIVSR
jgi:hypothetical protein